MRSLCQRLPAPESRSMVLFYCLAALSIPIIMEGHCPLRLETGGFSFSLWLFAARACWAAIGTRCSRMAMLTHMYIPSSVLCKGSDLIVAAGKKHWGAFRWVGYWRRSEWEFLHRSGKRAIELDGRKQHGISGARYQDVNVYVP